MASKTYQRCDRFTRRDLMRVGGLTALGFGVGDLFRWQRTNAFSNEFAKAKSCILIWLDGGPSHLETFDPKPNAPKEVRGPLDTISTKIPGVAFSECLPKTATIADKLTVIRSMTSPLGEHNFGTHYLMTGFKPTPVLEYPTIGAVTTHLQNRPSVLPSHVAVPQFNVGGSKLTGNGYLPSAVRPFSLGADPARADFHVRDLDFYKGIDIQRLDRRIDFVNALNEFNQNAERSNELNDSDLQRAYKLVSSDEAKRAFDLHEEPQHIRQKYGTKSIGQSCLLARRLVERGVAFVTVNNRGWDTHENLYTRLKEGYTGARVGVGLVPSLDVAFSSLVEDLEQRGLLSQTLVVVMGEFGRTPKLNTAGGRDHWPRVFSVVLAGGGVSQGCVIGSSDAVGESPQDSPVTPSDLAATIYRLLGIDPEVELKTKDGRPIRIVPHGSSVIQDAIA